jgi:hypothetical protein
LPATVSIERIRVRVTRALITITWGLVWRLLGLPFAGRRLVARMSDPETEIQGLAAMMLTRAGARSLPLVLKEIAAARNLALALTIVASMDPRPHTALFNRFAAHADPAIAEAARAALALARAVDRAESSGASR